MNYDEARRAVILYSLLLSGFLIPFFFLAGSFGYPLAPDQATQTLSLIVPVFLGYLGSATAFVFNPPRLALPEPTKTTQDLLKLLINGAFLVFAVAFASLLVGFGVANGKSVLPGMGMSFSAFSNGITITLSVMSTIVGGAVIYLFGAQAADVQSGEPGREPAPKPPPTQDRNAAGNPVGG